MIMNHLLEPLPDTYTGTHYNMMSHTSSWYLNGQLKKKIYHTNAARPFIKEFIVYYAYHDRIGCIRVDTFEEMFDSLTEEEKEIVIWNLDIWKLNNVKNLGQNIYL